MQIKRLLLATAATATAAFALIPATAAHADTPAPTADAFAAYAAEAFADSGLPALSLVVTHGSEVVYSQGFGEGFDGQAVTAQTSMRVASVSKSFTAMAVMKLVEAGKISLDDTVAAQVPGFAMADPRFADITVRHLLNQTSGLSDRGLDAMALRDAPDLAAFTALLADGELQRDPGAGYEYCNANYDLLARLVEVASGESFTAYLDREVFAPLGMTGSSLGGEAPQGGIEAFGLWSSADELWDDALIGGSGDVVTNADDMGRWLIGQNGGGTQLVGADSLTAMHSPSSVSEYGMGWGVEKPDDGGPDQIVHAGNLFTYTANQMIIPETGYGFAVMSPTSAIYDESYDILTGLADLSQGREPAGSGTLWIYELVIGLTALAALGLGALGLARSRRWAARREGRPVWRIALRLSPMAIPVLLFAAYPSLLGVLFRRDIDWAQCWYRAPSLLILLAAGAAAALAVIAARVVRLAK
ncbi:serine hydrolase domain-containing protein [Phytomonospora endophytica]|uniref:CubicO group peptidase (Beta-lactamase class C family) n=1 Tax=Phytomonospora endophytica TaxID=714109 RepID=A0A841FPL4_9ACTN|nr:serine hydrolase domain-containing protein [Phytomonospora endophytica]MBB6035197.1 CubicO group peptidase (beta-lactamase class C family) [Phytomonospora endophytica]GIG64054.1 hypothetical protein Pen01_03490 [Phytomonospora endophytica]